MSARRGGHRRAHAVAGRTLICCLWIGLAHRFADDACARDSAERAGDALRIAIPAAALALTVKRRDPQGRRDFYESLGMTAVGTVLLKETVDKRRPDGTDDEAFPSGHASVAFQGAGFIHRRYGIRHAWPAYVLATYVGWTRVESDKHEPTDVLAGAALGLASAFLFGDRLQRLEVTPTVGDGVVGVRLRGSFGKRAREESRLKPLLQRQSAPL